MQSKSKNLFNDNKDRYADLKAGFKTNEGTDLLLNLISLMRSEMRILKNSSKKFSCLL